MNEKKYIHCRMGIMDFVFSIQGRTHIGSGSLYSCLYESYTIIIHFLLLVARFSLPFRWFEFFFHLRYFQIDFSPLFRGFLREIWALVDWLDGFVRGMMKKI